MPWTLRLLAGLFDVCRAVGLKHTAGLSCVVPTALTVAARVADVLPGDSASPL